jgi:thiol-disulfide isomerase/thioredoxin
LKAWIQRLILFTLLGLAAFLVIEEYQAGFAKQYKERIGEILPQITDISWLGGLEPESEISTLYIRWEIWCPACLQSIEKNNEISQKYANNLRVIGLTTQWDDAVKDFSAKTIQYPVGFDSKGLLDKIFEIRAIPFYVLVNENRKILYQGNSIDEEVIKALL